MSSIRELDNFERLALITSLVVLPIAGSALLLTIYHYRSQQMWQLYLVLTISVLTSLCTIANELLFWRENYYWYFDAKSFGAESFAIMIGNCWTLKPVGYVIYALQNYQSVLKFLQFPKEHLVAPVISYLVAIATVLAFATFCACAGYDKGFLFRLEIEKSNWWYEAFLKA